MRKGLGEREAAVAGVEPFAEERERDLEGAARLRPERSDRLVEAAPVVLDELAGARDRVLDRVVVARERNGRRQLDRALERGQIVPEGVRADPDRGRRSG